MNSFWRVSAACMVQTGNILPIEMHMFQSCTACNKKHEKSCYVHMNNWILGCTRTSQDLLKFSDPVKSSQHKGYSPAYKNKRARVELIDFTILYGVMKQKSTSERWKGESVACAHVTASGTGTIKRIDHFTAHRNNRMSVGVHSGFLCAQIQPNATNWFHLMWTAVQINCI